LKKDQKRGTRPKKKARLNPKKSEASIYVFIREKARGGADKMAPREALKPKPNVGGG